MSPSIFPLASLASNLVLALICVAAAGVAGVAAYFFFFAKKREAEAPTRASGDSPVALGEMRELTSRIEEIVTQQQDNGETQRAHLSRKIDGIRESVESQHHAVTGLRQELRHEVQRRDQEMLEIRSQIESVREGIGLPSATRAALPPGPSAAELGAPEAEATMTPVSLTFDGLGDEEPTSGDAGPASGLFASMSFDSGDADMGSDNLFSGDADASGETDDSPFAPMGFAFEEEPEAPAAEPPAAEPPAKEAAVSPFAPMSFEADDPALPTLDPEAPMVLSFLEEDDFEPLAPIAAEPTAEAPTSPFVFEEAAPSTFDTPEDQAAETPEPEAPALTPMTFSFEDDAPEAEPPVAPASPFEVVSFLEPEPQPDATATPEATPAPAAPRMPQASAAPEATDRPPAMRPPTVVSEPARQASGATAGASGESAFPPVTFEAPVVEAEMPEAPTAWISRPDRTTEDETPAETIGGIQIERVGDVPPASPLAAHLPETEPVEPVAPTAEADDFPSPVVANELATEQPLDFGLDIEAELAAMGVDPLDLPLTAAPVVPSDGALAPEVDRFRHAPVPPFRLEGEAEPVQPEPVQPEPVQPEPVQPEPVRAAAPTPLTEVDRTMPVPTPFDASEFVSTPPAASAPAPRPAPATPPAATPVPAPAPTPEAAQAPEATPPGDSVVPPFEAPEGAEDLTVISSIDEDVQRALYMAGVTSLDDMARWGRTEARRIAAEVGVSETTIMNQWIFEAQAALFDRFSGR